MRGGSLHRPWETPPSRAAISARPLARTLPCPIPRKEKSLTPGCNLKHQQGPNSKSSVSSQQPQALPAGSILFGVGGQEEPPTPGSPPPLPHLALSRTLEKFLKIIFWLQRQLACRGQGMEPWGVVPMGIAGP